MRLLTFAVTIVCLGCGGLFPRPDAGMAGGGSASAGGGSAGGGAAGGGSAGGGSAGGGSAGGGSAGGGSAGGGSAGGGSAGGGSAGGGSASGGGSAGPWQFSNLTLPISAGGALSAIASNATELYAATENGRFIHMTFGQAVTEITGRPTASVEGLWVGPTGAVVIASSKSVASCASNCTVWSSYTSVPVTETADFLSGLCGVSPTEIYLPGNRAQNVGVLYRWNGSQLSKLSNDLGVTYASGCVTSNGAVLVAAQKNFARYFQNAVDIETPNLSALSTSEQDMQVWYGIGLVGTTPVGVGTRMRVVVRQPNGSWTLALNPNAPSATLMAVGGPSTSDGFAGGTVSSQGAKYFVTLTAGTWQVSPTNPPFLNGVRAVHVVGQNELYLGGVDGSGTPTLVRARR